MVEHLPAAQGYGTAYYLQTTLILLLFSGAVLPVALLKYPYRKP